MMTSRMFLPAFLLWGWAAGGVTLSLTCGHCEKGSDGYSCPGVEGEVYHLQAISSNTLRVDCKANLRELNFSLFERCDLEAYTQLEFHQCPLPTTSFGEVFRRMGVPSSNVSFLTFTEGTFTTSPGLQEWHLDSLPSLQTLELVDNNFTSIPPALLTNTPKLRFFRFIGNRMDSLPHTLLASTPNLVMADLGNNKLNNLPEDLFANLTKLTNVSLWNNALADLQENIFTDIPNLRFLDLRDNLISVIPQGLFRNMKILKKLNLARNKLKTLSRDVFRDLVLIEELDLRSNILEDLPLGIFDYKRKMKKLILKDNNINTMPDEMFKRCESLQILDISFNNLQYIIATQLPRPKTSLTHLYLRNNNISFNPDYIDAPGIHFILLDFPLSSQTNLQTIDLSNNRITEFPSSLNILFLHLKVIDLSGNKLNFLDFHSMRFVSQNIKMNLKNNNIKMVSLRGMEFVKLMNERNVTLSLEGNPLVCNCLLYLLTKIVQGKSEEMSKTLFNLHVDDADKLKCIDLENRTMALQKTDFKMLTCKLDICLHGCSCYWRRHDEMYIVDCPSQGLKEIPSPLSSELYNIKKYSITLNLINNNITNFDGLQHPFYKNLANLTLANNKISFLNESDLPENLKVLDLRGNNLTAFAASTLDYLNTTDMTLSLGGNPWICNCDMMDFWTFLKVPERKVLDERNIRCASDDELLININEYSVCPFFRQPMVIVTIVLITLFLLLFAVFGTISFYKYKQGIKVWLFTHRLCLWAVTEDELDADKKYDAFISYSHKDEEFVNTVLVPGLESGDPKYRICLHYRDWIPGEYIQNQILWSVDNSRRTIVVLSPNFIESVWSQLEFKAAHSQALQDRTNRIIVIVYGQVPPKNDLDEKLQLYIAMKTYVKWGDAKFWEKLRYMMPHPQELIQKPQQNNKIVKDKLELVKSNSKVSV